MRTILETMRIAGDFRRAHDLRAAAELYRQVLVSDPQHAEAYCALGTIARQMGAYGQAESLGVIVTDTLPPGVTLLETAGCAEDPAGVTDCTLGTIAAGGARRSRFVSGSTRARRHRACDARRARGFAR